MVRNLTFQKYADLLLHSLVKQLLQSHSRFKLVDLLLPEMESPVSIFAGNATGSCKAGASTCQHNHAVTSHKGQQARTSPAGDMFKFRSCGKIMLD